MKPSKTSRARNQVAFYKTCAGVAVAASLLTISLPTAAETDREYCERQQGPARVVCMRDLDRAQAAPKAAAVPPVATTATESDREYCERQQGPARIVCTRQLEKAAAAPVRAATAAASPAAVAASSKSGGADAAPVAGAALYKVVDGYHVDPMTLIGFKVWRSAACDRCHGANQEGLVGPSLVESLKTLSKADFVKTLTYGRLQRGMPSFGSNKNLIENIDHLYAYLKGRSDGAITKSKVEPIQ